MRTASSPSRKTMMAVFVTTVAVLVGPEPIADSARESAESSPARVSAIWSAVACRATSWARPWWPSAPYQK